MSTYQERLETFVVGHGFQYEPGLRTLACRGCGGAYTWPIGTSAELPSITHRDPCIVWEVDQKLRRRAEKGKNRGR